MQRGLKAHDGDDRIVRILRMECVFVTTNVKYDVLGEEFLVGGS